jgi:hypothetical protein
LVEPFEDGDLVEPFADGDLVLPLPDLELPVLLLLPFPLLRCRRSAALDPDEGVLLAPLPDEGDLLPPFPDEGVLLPPFPEEGLLVLPFPDFGALVEPLPDLGPLDLEEPFPDEGALVLPFPDEGALVVPFPDLELLLPALPVLRPSGFSPWCRKRPRPSCRRPPVTSRRSFGSRPAPSGPVAAEEAAAAAEASRPQTLVPERERTRRTAAREGRIMLRAMVEEIDGSAAEESESGRGGVDHEL